MTEGVRLLEIWTGVTAAASTIAAVVAVMTVRMATRETRSHTRLLGDTRLAQTRNNVRNWWYRKRGVPHLQTDHRLTRALILYVADNIDHRVDYAFLPSGLGDWPYSLVHRHARLCVAHGYLEIHNAYRDKPGLSLTLAGLNLLDYLRPPDTDRTDP